VKNVGPSAVDAILAARKKVGRFRSLFDFCEHVDLGTVNRRVMESLIKAGAMDSLGGNRAQLFAAIESAMEHGQKVWRDRESGQAVLFGGLLAATEAEDRPLADVPDWPASEKLAGEKETLGFFVTGHPLDAYEEKVKELATHDTSALEGLERGTEVTLCGILTGVQRRRNREGKPWASMQIEDRVGSVEAVVFTTSYERVQEFLSEDLPVMVRGSVLPEENAPPKISVQDVVPLDVARVALPSLISIRVWLGSNGGETDKAAALERLFRQKPGETAVRLRLEKPRDFAVLLDVEARVRPDREFQAEVERICGPEAIEILAQ
jgi:DNA polymerase-3 subunit alpha